MRAIAAGRKGLYNDWISQDGLMILKGWARDGLTDGEIAKNIGVTQYTLIEWKKKFPQIADTIKEGRRPIIVEVEDSFFEKKLKGYFVEEEIVEVTKHPNGEKTEHRKKMKRWIPPDTTALIFYLKCRKPQQYNDKLAISADNEATNGKLDALIEAVKEI